MYEVVDAARGILTGVTIRAVKFVYSPNVGLYTLYSPFPVAVETIARGASPIMDSCSMWPVLVFTRFPGRRGLESIRLAVASYFFWTRTMSFSGEVLVESREGSGVRWMKKGKFQRGWGADLGRYSCYKSGQRMVSMRSLPLPGEEHCRIV